MRRRILLLGAIEIDLAIVTASALTYSRHAITPTPTVTLNGNVIPSKYYDVSYSNNINAGTATITVVGKGNYTGTATGSFIINKATPTYVAPKASSLTYNGSNLYLTTIGSTLHGTIQYSENGSSWSTTRILKTAAGTYTTYWRLVGDNNHTDVNSTSISATVAKANRTISISNLITNFMAGASATNTPTVSAGSSEGTISCSSSATEVATINNNGLITGVGDGTTTITVTISAGTNYNAASTTYTVKCHSYVCDFDYTGNVQAIAVGTGDYYLLCWGAEGGANAADSDHSIYVQDPGKGGYAEGVLTISSPTILYAFVGGKGNSLGNGGWNGGGGCTNNGVSSYDSDGIYGITMMGCGGGSTDFCTVSSSMSYSSSRTNRSSESLLSRILVAGGGGGSAGAMYDDNGTKSWYNTNGYLWGGGTTGGNPAISSVSDSYPHVGKQNTGYAFGYGSTVSKSNYRFVPPAGGGGWYGGGSDLFDDRDYNYLFCSGGGSGFVNIASNSSYRPSGYTGLQLNSGFTMNGGTSFKNITNTGNETGHTGNGYARISRRIKYTFNYIGAVQTVTLSAGSYTIQCWGAQGGSYNTTYYGGKGGYSVGKLTLSKSTTVYVYVGGQGTGGTTVGEKTGGFNGGGRGYSPSTTYIECGGGGASDVRIGQDSLYARVIVAGGGGGAGSYNASNRYVGGAGGGVAGTASSQYSSSYKAGTGGTATKGGNSYYGSTANSTTYGTLAAFGIGAGAISGNTSYQVTGGGAGWYGGGYSRRGAGGGGSGYVYTSTTAANYPSGCLLNSSYYLTDAQTIAGNTSFTAPNGSSETGHSGDGCVIIVKNS